MQYIAAVGSGAIFLIILNRKGLAKEFDVKSVGIYLGALIFSELAKSFILVQSGGFSALKVLFTGFTLLPQFWVQSILSFQLLYGGYLSNALIYGLCIVGVYYLSFRRLPEAHIWALLLVSSFVFLFGDDSIKGRLLFNIPLSILEGFGFVVLLLRSEKMKRSLTTYIVLFSIVYLFRSLANLVPL